MLNQLIHALVQTGNQAADDLLLQALQMGAANEQRMVVDVLLKRKSSRGMNGIVGAYENLPESLQSHVLANIRLLHHALAECGRSNDANLRLSAIRLIAVGRQGKLAYVLSENLHSTDITFSKAATEAIVSLARWVAGETKRLQRGSFEGNADGEMGGMHDGETRRRGDGEKEEENSSNGSAGCLPVTPSLRLHVLRRLQSRLRPADGRAAGNRRRRWRGR